MSRIYIPKNALHNIYDIIVKNEFDRKYNKSKKHTITLVKRYHMIHDVLHSQRLFPIELENIITNYIDEIIDINYYMTQLSCKSYELTFTIENQFINFINYRFSFVLKIQFHNNPFTYILYDVFSDNIITTTHDYITALDNIVLLNTYLRHINKKQIVVLSDFEKHSKCIYKQNLIACLFDNKRDICGIDIINHKQFQNVIVILQCIINRLIKDINGEYSFLCKKIDKSII